MSDSPVLYEVGPGGTSFRNPGPTPFVPVVFRRSRVKEALDGADLYRHGDLRRRKDPLGRGSLSPPTPCFRVGKDGSFPMWLRIISEVPRGYGERGLTPEGRRGWLLRRPLPLLCGPHRPGRGTSGDGSLGFECGVWGSQVNLTSSKVLDRFVNVHSCIYGNTEEDPSIPSEYRNTVTIVNNQNEFLHPSNFFIPY